MKIKNKICLLGFLLLGVSVISTNNIVNAESIDLEEKYKVEQKIYMEDFFSKYNVKDENGLNEKQINEYIDGIEKIKKKYFNTEKPKGFNIGTRAAQGYLPNVERNPYTGDIYVTMDRTWKNGDYFGHAGLGGYHKYSVFEMIPSQGLILRKKGHYRWTNYKSGGRFEVSGARKTHYDGAADYGYWKLKKGLSYSLLGNGKDSDYCSGFVYRAWKSEGFDISNDNFFKPCIAPWDLMNDNDTYKVQSFGD